MQLEQALAEIQDVRNRVLLSKRGEGPIPSEEEIRIALDKLRGARRSAAEATKKGKTTMKNVDLDTIFAKMPGV